MRIKVSGELGTAVMSLAVIGLYYGAASFLVENVILRNLTEEERDEHILSKLLFWSTVILLVADVLLVITSLRDAVVAGNDFRFYVAEPIKILKNCTLDSL